MTWRRPVLCLLGLHLWKRRGFWPSRTFVFPKKVKVYDCERCPRRKTVTDTGYAGDVVLGTYDRPSPTPRKLT